MSVIIEQYENMMIVKNWTEATKATYRSLLKKFLFEFKGNVQRATTDELIKYIASMPSRSSMAQMYGVLKNLYAHVLKQKRKFGFVPFPKKEFTIYKLIEHAELLKMCNLPRNTKHKLILNMLYGTGLRVSEICELKWSDIERTGKPINPLALVVNGKGNKQRRIPISSTINQMLIAFCKEYKLNCDNSDDYIFGGKKPYSVRSVANICEKYCGVSPHKIRHAYSQWMHDNGTELETLRQLLGHNSLSTVQIYARTKPEKIITPV